MSTACATTLDDDFMAIPITSFSPTWLSITWFVIEISSCHGRFPCTPSGGFWSPRCRGSSHTPMAHLKLCESSHNYAMISLKSLIQGHCRKPTRRDFAKISSKYHHSAAMFWFFKVRIFSCWFNEEGKNVPKSQQDWHWDTQILWKL